MTVGELLHKLEKCPKNLRIKTQFDLDFYWDIETIEEKIVKNEKCVVLILREG